MLLRYTLMIVFPIFLFGCNPRSTNKQSTNRFPIDTSFTVENTLTNASTPERVLYRVQGHDWLGTLTKTINVFRDTVVIFTDSWHTAIACEAADRLKNAKSKADTIKAAEKRKEDELYYFSHPYDLFDTLGIKGKSIIVLTAFWDDAHRRGVRIKDSSAAFSELKSVLNNSSYYGFHYSRDPFGDDAPRYAWVPKINTFLCYNNN